MFTSLSVSGTRLCALWGKGFVDHISLSSHYQAWNTGDIWCLLMTGIWQISGFPLLLNYSHLWETEELGIRLLQGFSHCLHQWLRQKQSDSRMIIPDYVGLISTSSTLITGEPKCARLVLCLCVRFFSLLSTPMTLGTLLCITLPYWKK